MRSQQQHALIEMTPRSDESFVQLDVEEERKEPQQAESETFYQGHTIRVGAPVGATVLVLVTEVFSLLGGVLALYYEKPEISYPFFTLGFGACCLYTATCLDTRRQFSKEVRKFGAYLDRLAVCERQMGNNAKGLKKALASAHQFVVKEGFKQVNDLRLALIDEENPERNVVEELSLRIDGLVSSQMQMLEKLGAIGRAGTLLSEGHEQTAKISAEIQADIQEMIEARQGQQSQLQDNIGRIRDLQGMLQKGAGIVDLFSRVVKDIQNTSEEMAKGREDLVRLTTELESLGGKNEERAESVAVLVQRVEQQIRILRDSLDSKEKQIAENKEFVDKIVQIAEGFGGMDQFLQRVGQAI